MCLSLEPTVGSIVCCVPLCSDKLMDKQDKLRLSSASQREGSTFADLPQRTPNLSPQTPLLNT